MPEQQEKAGELAAGLVSDAHRMVELQVELAKQEVKELLIRNVIAVGLLAGGAGLVILAVLVALPIVLILRFANRAEAALVWLGIDLTLAVICLAVGWILLHIPKAQETRTLSSLTETRRWLLRQISSNGR